MGATCGQAGRSTATLSHFATTFAGSAAICTPNGGGVVSVWLGLTTEFEDKFGEGTLVPPVQLLRKSTAAGITNVLIRARVSTPDPRIKSTSSLDPSPPHTPSRRAHRAASPTQLASTSPPPYEGIAKSTSLQTAPSPWRTPWSLGPLAGTRTASRDRDPYRPWRGLGLARCGALRVPNKEMRAEVPTALLAWLPRGSAGESADRSGAFEHLSRDEVPWRQSPSIETHTPRELPGGSSLAACRVGKACNAYRCSRTPGTGSRRGQRTRACICAASSGPCPDPPRPDSRFSQEATSTSRCFVLLGSRARQERPAKPSWPRRPERIDHRHAYVMPTSHTSSC